MKSETILLALLKKGRMCYQEVVNLGFRRKNTRVALDRFIEEGLVEEDCANWKPGRRLFYSLTPRGEKRVIETSLANVALALKNVRDLTAHLVRNPERLSELRNALSQPLLLTNEIKDLPIEKSIDLFEKRESQTHGLLRESLKALFALFLETEPLPKELRKEIVMGFTEEGGIYLIPTALLKKHGLGVGL